MTVIDFAEKRLNEESCIPNSRNVQYWAAYLDGARAQKKEDVNSSTNQKPNMEGARQL